jgi:hypothetical protein
MAVTYYEPESLSIKVGGADRIDVRRDKRDEIIEVELDCYLTLRENLFSLGRASS